MYKKVFPDDVKLKKVILFSVLMLHMFISSNIKANNYIVWLFAYCKGGASWMRN